MKSGAWLSSWKSVPVKRAVHLNPEVLPETTSPDTEIEYVDISALEAGSAAELASKPLKFGAAPSRARRVLRDGDTVVSTVRTYLKAVATFPVVEGHLVASTGFAVLRPNGTLLPRFAYWAVLSEPFVEAVVAHSEGVSYPAISPSVLGDLRLPVPPIVEQQRIANFLDEQTARIDALIAEKERLIAKLVDLREAEVCYRLIPGLFVGITHQDNIDGWSLKLPAEWKVKALRRVLRGGLTNGVFKKRDAFGVGRLLVNVGDLYRTDFRVSAETLGRVTVTDDEYERFKVEVGDIFFVRSSLKEEGVAVSAIVDTVPEPMVFECHVVRAKPDNSQVVPRFLSLWLNSSICRQLLRRRSNTTTMTTIDQDGLLSVHVPVPPLHQQKAIVEQIEALFMRTEQLSDVARCMQNRLREYRSSLISAAVTGQLDIDAYRAPAPEALEVA